MMTILLSSLGLAILKLTALLALAIVWILLVRRAEPRWRVAVARTAFAALPVVILAAALDPLWRVPVMEAALPEAAAPRLAHVAETPALPASSIAEERTTVPWPFLAAVVWVAGALWHLGRGAVALAGMAARARRADEAPEAISHEWQRLCSESGIAKAPLLRVVGERLSPCLLPGRPGVLLLPACLTTPEEGVCRLHAFRHEAAHLRHHDRFWLLAGRFCAAVLWWHPLVWWLAALHHQACEEAADADAARRSETGSYHRALAELALILTPTRMPAPTLLRGTSVLRRLRVLPGNAERRPPCRLPLALLAGAALAVAVFGGNFGIAPASAQEQGRAGRSESETTQYAMRRLILPLVEFRDLPIEEVLAEFRKMVAEQDTGQALFGPDGLQIALADGVNPAVRITLRLTNVPFSEALRYTASLADAHVATEGKQIRLAPGAAPATSAAPAGIVPAAPGNPAVAGAVFHTNVYSVDGAKLKRLQGEAATIREAMEKRGIAFSPGTGAVYDDAVQRLIVRQTVEGMKQVEAWLEEK